MRKLLQFVLGEAVDQNGWYLCLEIFWATIFGAAASFNAALAIRLGATNAQVSWLASGTALTALVIIPLVGRFLQSRTRRNPWVLWSLWVFRMSTLLLILIPWVQLPFVPSGLLVIGVILLFTVPMHVVSVGMVPFLSEAVAVEQRATVFSARNAVSGVAGMACSVLFGAVLVLLPFPYNYQVVLGVGFVFAMLSSYYLARVKVVEQVQPPPTAATARSLRERWAGFTGGLKASPGFVHISINSLLNGLGNWAAAPLFTLYILRELNLGENWLGVLAAATSVAAIAGNIAWRRLMGRWGEFKTLKVTMLLLGLYPLLTGLTGWGWLIVLAAASNGFMSAGANISLFNTFLRVVPADKRHDYTALNLTLLNVGMMVAPLISVALASQFGFGRVLVGCGLLSMLGSLAFVVWPVGESTPAPAPLVADRAAAGR